MKTGNSTDIFKAMFFAINVLFLYMLDGLATENMLAYGDIARGLVWLLTAINAVLAYEKTRSFLAGFYAAFFSEEQVSGEQA